MRVVVLMSTYQGEQFVAEQIDSILKYLPPEGLLMVRDDGSHDRTASIVQSFVDSRITLTCGPNIGFARSFFTLMAQTPDDAEMIMLSDQDDVWLPHKIGRAWEYLKDSDGVPTLYCARQQLVDGNLRPIALSKHWPRGPSFENALTENIVTGCTIALNRAAHSLVLSVGDKRRIYFHDWWIYLVISALGKVVMDEEPTILYRQHGNNVVGRGAGIKRYLINLAFIRRKSWVHIMFNQIENFRAVHATTLPPEKRKLLDQSFNPRRGGSVVRLLCVPTRYRQFLLDEFLLRLLVLSEILTGRGLLPK